jgi:hypothetical protein
MQMSPQFQVLKIISAGEIPMHRGAFIWLMLNASSSLAWKRVPIPFDLASDRFRINTDTFLDCPFADGKPDDLPERIQRNVSHGER